ncbi:MAG: glycosyltransferase family A protein [Myxococcota bacterium]|jgi:glycosyltransferase involved in cell wall biosynthesis|nr:glycosyltransferase family A protein [Myxococcota bacterium]
MNTPRASILLPVFDAERWLGVCLRSLQRQRMGDWECVLVDDGSSDGSLAIAREFAAGDPRIRVFAEPHAGLIAALQFGLAHCRAPIVVRMDADDWMHRDRLALQCAAFDDDRSLCAVGTRVRLFPRSRAGDTRERPLPGEEARVRTGRFGYEAWLNAIESPRDVVRNAWIECPIAHPTLAIRREALERFGYRDVPWPEDYDLVLRLIAAGERLGVVPKRLVAWREAGDRLSRRSTRYDTDAFAACKAAHLAQTFLRERGDYGLWGYGGTGRLLASKLQEHGLAPRHIVDVHPRRVGQRIRGAPVIAPEALAHHERTPLVVSVAGTGARQEIRGFLEGLDYREGRDFVCAA